MNIKCVSERTGTTKRAIKYYEEQGLIKPKKNPQSGYREYSESDVVLLNYIATLRLLDISVADVKGIISGEKCMRDMLNSRINDIDSKIDELEKNKKVMEYIRDNGKLQNEDSGESIRKMRETLELSRFERTIYIRKELERIIPGYYGEFIGAMYEPFCDIKIKNEKDKKLWLEMVESLDNQIGIDEDDEHLKNFNQLIGSDDFKNEAIRAIEEDNKRIERVIQGDSHAIDQLYEEFIRNYANMKENKDEREMFDKRVKDNKDFLERNKVKRENTTRSFTDILRELSPKFHSYLNIVEGIMDRVETELGVKVERGTIGFLG